MRTTSFSYKVFQAIIKQWGATGKTTRSFSLKLKLDHKSINFCKKSEIYGVRVLQTYLEMNTVSFSYAFFGQAQNFSKLWGTEGMVIGKLQGCECEPKKSVKSGGV